MEAVWRQPEASEKRERGEEEEAVENNNSAIEQQVRFAAICCSQWDAHTENLHPIGWFLLECLLLWPLWLARCLLHNFSFSFSLSLSTANLTR